MELFWIIFWILLLAIPAYWLVSLLWGIAFYLVIFLIGCVSWAFKAIVNKVKGE